MSLTKPNGVVEIMLALYEDGQLAYQFTGLNGPVESQLLWKIFVTAANAVAAKMQQEHQPQTSHEMLTTEPQSHLLPEVLIHDESHESTGRRTGVQAPRSAGKPVAA